MDVLAFLNLIFGSISVDQTSSEMWLTPSKGRINMRSCEVFLQSYLLSEDFPKL